MVANESHEERTRWWAKGHQKRPNTHVLGSFLLEKGLGHDARPNGNCWRDKESTERSADAHRSVSVAQSAAYVEQQGTHGTDEPDRSSSVAVGNWFPEQRRPAEDSNCLLYTSDAADE